MAHKWAKEIKAWADGAEIDYKNPIDEIWDTVLNPIWERSGEFRIKPQPKEPQYLYVYKTNKGIELGLAPHPAMNMYDTTIIGKIKLETDDGA